MFLHKVVLEHKLGFVHMLMIVIKLVLVQMWMLVHMMHMMLKLKLMYTLYTQGRLLVELIPTSHNHLFNQIQNVRTTQP